MARASCSAEPLRSRWTPTSMLYQSQSLWGSNTSTIRSVGLRLAPLRWRQVYDLPLGSQVRCVLAPFPEPSVYFRTDHVIRRRGTRLRRERRCCRWSQAGISRSPLLVEDTHTAWRVRPCPRSPRRAGVRTTRATRPTFRARPWGPCSRWSLGSRHSPDHPGFFAGKGLDPRTFVLLWFTRQLLRASTTSRAC